MIDGEKWFSSNFRYAAFAIVMAVTDPDVPVYQGTSMFLVPTDTPGIEIIRNVGLGGEPRGRGLARVRALQQRARARRQPARRRGPGVRDRADPPRRRPHPPRDAHRRRVPAGLRHDVRARAVAGVTQGEVLAKKQMVQEKIADSYIELEQFRLHGAARGVDDRPGRRRTRRAREIAVVKVLTPKVLHDIVYRALHIHGSLGTSNEMPLIGMWTMMPVMGIADGPTEVHKVTVARQVLKEYKPSEGLFPSAHLPPRQEAARKKFADLLEHEVAQH